MLSSLAQIRIRDLKKSLVNELDGRSPVCGGRRLISTKYHLTKADVRDILMVEGREFYLDFRTEKSVRYLLETKDLGFGVYEVYLRKA